MASLSKIVSRNPISNFSRVGLESGRGMALLTTALEQVYSRLEPAAIEEQKRQGAERGRREAKSSAPVGKAAFDGIMKGSQADLFSGLEAQYGLPSGYLGRTSQIESVGNPNAKNPRSSATGPFQFIDSTARQYGLEDRRNVRASADAAARLARDNAGVIRAALGRDPTAGELYLAHQQGGGGAAGLLANPDARAVDIVGKEAVLLNGGTEDMTAGAFAGKWLSKFGPDFTVATRNENTPTEVRTADGSLKTLRYSPLSGPILQAHNIAANMAYQSEVMVQGVTQLSEISRQFEFDPSGFETAAEAYIDEVSQAAPTDLEPFIRADLEKEANRQYLGIADAKHRDIRNRARSSNKALIDRYSADFTEAIVSGNQEAIDDARQSLDDALRAREALPGSGWTMENSANVILDAQRSASREAERRTAAAAREIKGDLQTIISAIKSGRIAENEEILDDEGVAILQPELVREAKAFQALRDGMPEYLQMTPAEQAAAVAKMKETEVAEEWQIDVVEAAEKVAKENAKAWASDPAKRAGEVLETPPPDIMAPIETGDPEQISEAMSARVDYMTSEVFEKGYSRTIAFLTEDEAQSLQSLVGKDVDPSIRALLAGSIVEGSGIAGVRIMDEINGDSLTMYAGKMSASGAPQALAAEIFRGQQVMDEGIVKMPEKSAFIDVVSSEFDEALNRMPAGPAARGSILEAARAIYASRAMGAEIQDAQPLIRESINAAMGGGVAKNGDATGGVQEIFGINTALPVGVSGKEVNLALSRALGQTVESRDITSRLLGSIERAGGAIIGTKPKDPDLTAFEAAGGIPYIGGEPLNAKTTGRARFSISPLTGNLYTLQIHTGDTVTDARTARGDIYTFDLKALLEASE